MARFVSLLLMACTLGLSACGAPPSGVDLQDPPRCLIREPLHGSALPFGPVEVVAEASHPGGITHFELCVDGAPFAVSALPGASKSPATMRWVWEPGLAGTYVLQARARSASGAWGQYARIVVTIRPEEPTPTRTPAPTATPRPSATSTATPTPTLTPTPRPAPATAPPEASPSPVVVIAADTPAPAAGSRISGPRASTAHFYYSSADCGPQEITISVEATDPSGIASVRIYYALADKSTGAMTPWSYREMAFADGRWSCTINPSRDIPRHDAYANAWFQVYFVATNGNGLQTQSPGYYTAYTLSRCGQ
ncbi:MAG: hypothetical protein K6V36_09575 [Anaerolineae bacterium]|nr:hypothetical protein [Anaerolineae bacterium]